MLSTWATAQAPNRWSSVRRLMLHVQTVFYATSKHAQITCSVIRARPASTSKEPTLVLQQVLLGVPSTRVISRVLVAIMVSAGKSQAKIL